ncbi:RNA polymerase sigma factor [Bordetella avium]|nr:RNA polymerase sigma factor [Bordetella avium]
MLLPSHNRRIHRQASHPLAPRRRANPRLAQRFPQAIGVLLAPNLLSTINNNYHLQEYGMTSSKQAHVETLYADHHGWLQSWMRRQLGNSFEAADLAHDVFLRLLRRPAAIETREPRAYLSAIARGLLIDHWRRRELERAWLEALAHTPEALAPSPETRMLVLEALIKIDQMLDTLKPKVRQAFLWAQLEGMRCPQIAQRLGVSLATAERYVAAGLRHCYACRFGEP